MKLLFPKSTCTRYLFQGHCSLRHISNNDSRDLVQPRWQTALHRLISSHFFIAHAQLKGMPFLNVFHVEFQTLFWLICCWAVNMCYFQAAVMADKEQVLINLNSNHIF